MTIGFGWLAHLADRFELDHQPCTAFIPATFGAASVPITYNTCNRLQCDWMHKDLGNQ